MTRGSGLPASKLRWHCDPEQFDFDSTSDLPDLREILGQARALDAIRFGIGIRQQGYNLYVLGPPGMGKRTTVRQFLEQQAAGEPTPDDWCYVNNFEQTYKPKALRLPCGAGSRFAKDMQDLVEDLQNAIPAALEAEDHQNRVKDLENEAKERHDTAFRTLAKKAVEHGIELVRTPSGLALAPVRDGEVMDAEQFGKLPEDERRKIQEAIEGLQSELRALIEQVPEWRKEMRDKIKELNRQATHFAIGHSLEQARGKYADSPAVLEYLTAVEQDVIEHADDFRPDDEQPQLPFLVVPPDQRSFQRYQVNLLVDNSQLQGAPVVAEEHPNHRNLIGRVEHRAQMGMLTTDFTLIKPGALHRANGGYLMVEMLRLLSQPYAWEGLKRALHARHVQIESVAESLSLASTVSLEPEPIPLDVKVVLLGDRLLYYLLYEYDRDFAELFKVAVDFADDMDRGPDSCRMYARLIATLVRQRDFRPFDRGAVARVIEFAARAAEDSQRLTMHMRTVADLLAESDHWARRSDSPRVTAGHVQQAIDQQIYRVDRVRERVQDEIRRGTLLIDTRGSCVGQVNGLSVLDLGNFRFGRPSRITATTRLGRGEVVDIEREVDLGGAIHSKGMMILASFLAARFAKNQPLSLAASVVFEQSYGKVDGDSASVAELCAILSSLAEVPIDQSLAVTGSVNQHGTVQPIGGVNEKIEGYFDVCASRGLTGSQGVLIPASNVQHLMLRQDVLQAVADGQFQVYAVETVDQALELLTGVPAGPLDAAGQYPPDSIQGRVAARLAELLELRRRFGMESKPEGKSEEAKS
ncbi:MAG: AAA family ATPase [Pirellulaceae bacterium]|nr:AAA family ATPase [Pirellulaceae bacterium]